MGKKYSLKSRKKILPLIEVHCKKEGGDYPPASLWGALCFLNTSKLKIFFYIWVWKTLFMICLVCRKGDALCTWVGEMRFGGWSGAEGKWILPFLGSVLVYLKEIPLKFWIQNIVCKLSYWSQFLSRKTLRIYWRVYWIFSGE